MLAVDLDSEEGGSGFVPTEKDPGVFDVTVSATIETVL